MGYTAAQIRQKTAKYKQAISKTLEGFSENRDQLVPFSRAQIAKASGMPETAIYRADMKAHLESELNRLALSDYYLTFLTKGGKGGRAGGGKDNCPLYIRLEAALNEVDAQRSPFTVVDVCSKAGVGEAALTAFPALKAKIERWAAASQGKKTRGRKRSPAAVLGRCPRCFKAAYLNPSRLCNACETLRQQVLARAAQ